MLDQLTSIVHQFVEKDVLELSDGPDGAVLECGFAATLLEITYFKKLSFDTFWEMTLNEFTNVSWLWLLLKHYSADYNAYEEIKDASRIADSISTPYRLGLEYHSALRPYEIVSDDMISEIVSFMSQTLRANTSNHHFNMGLKESGLERILTRDLERYSQLSNTTFESVFDMTFETMNLLVKLQVSLSLFENRFSDEVLIQDTRKALSTFKAPCSLKI